MRQRLRPAHDPATLAELYATPHDHTRWQDHILRVDATVDLTQELCGGPVHSAADLSCGDAAVLNRLDVEHRHLGDLAPGYEYHGPIETTIHQIPPVDLFVCCETLEHLDDPDTVLKDIRAKTRLLVVSVPLSAWDDTNIEHYWAFDEAEVRGMLTTAGFETRIATRLGFKPFGCYYNYGIFCCG